MAYEDFKSTNNVLGCYTFGAPPVGIDEIITEEGKLPIFRLVNDSDIIPRIMFAGAFIIVFLRLVVLLPKTIRSRSKWVRDQVAKAEKWLTIVNDDMLKYKHPSAGVYFDKKGRYRHHFDEALSKTTFLKIFFEVGYKATFLDHKIDGYIEMIEKNLESSNYVERLN